MIYAGNLYEILGGYFELSFTIVEVHNLDAKLRVALYILHNLEVDFFIKGDRSNVCSWK
jgi:hypothetical protein